MSHHRTAAPVSGWPVWGRPLGLLLLILFGPLGLFLTPLWKLAETWFSLVSLALWLLAVALVIGTISGSPSGVLGWVEWHLRCWVARFAPDPEALWLHWARHAHYPETARLCLDRAVAFEGAEASFQLGLLYLEGGLGANGQVGALERFRSAAALGHPEAAYRVAEALRTGQVGGPDPAQAETWYRRSAQAGFGLAAAWLARAYEDGDGVPVNEEQARHWRGVAAALAPHQGLSHNLLRHDAAPEDPLVRLISWIGLAMEGGADYLLTHPAGRWGLGILAGTLGILWLGTAATFFWAGSSSLHHLPLIFMTPPLLALAWMAIQHRREGPKRGRDPLREAAEQGDPEACYRLGLTYRKGSHHLPKDDLGAALWFRKAAEQGHVGAMEALAEAYLGGHGLLRDPREAARWAEAARRESTSQLRHPMS